jgi:molecular chaperone GrpE
MIVRDGLGEFMERADTFDSAEETKRAEDEGVDYKDLYQRTLADFDNYRKRIDRERDEIGAAGKRDLLLGVVDVVDNFARAVESGADLDAEDPIGAGIVAIYRQLRKLLETSGVEQLPSVGRPFDPEIQEAVGLVASDDVPEDHVVSEVRPGYVWNGRLLRPARVFVSTGPSAE